MKRQSLRVFSAALFAAAVAACGGGGNSGDHAADQGQQPNSSATADARGGATGTAGDQQGGAASMGAGHGQPTGTSGAQTGSGGTSGSSAGTIGAGRQGQTAGASGMHQDFAQFVAMSNTAEIELGRLGERKAQNPEVKQFAARMVKEHTQAMRELQKMGGPAEQPELDAHHKQVMDRLSKLSGEEFDREFMRVMVEDHQKSVARFQQEAGSTAGAGGMSSGAGAGASGTAGTSSGTAGTTSGSGTTSGTAGTTSGTGGTASGTGSTAGSDASMSAGRGNRGQLSQWAKTKLPTLQQHLQLAQKIQSQVQ